MASWDYPAVNGPTTANYAAPQVDFSKIGNLLQDYYKGAEMQRGEEKATAFRNGIPRVGNDPNGPIDVNAVTEKLGRINPDYAMPLINMQIQGQQGQAAANAIMGGQPASGQPATSQPQQPQRPVQPGSAQPSAATPASVPTVMTILAAQGIPNDQLQAASESVSRQLGVGPTDPIDTKDPQVRNVLGPALQRLKGIGHVVQPQDAATDETGAAPQSAATPQQPQVPDQSDSRPGWSQSDADAQSNRATRLNAYAAAVANMNPKAAEAAKAEAAAAEGRAKQIRDYISGEDTSTTEMKNAAASGRASPEVAQVRTEELKNEVTRSEKTYSGMQGAASQFERDLKPYLDISKSILSQPGMYTGVGGDWSLAVNRVKSMFGDQKAAMLQEALGKITASSVLSQINTQKDQMMEAGSNSGRIFAQQVALVEKAAPALATTLGGNRFLINVADKMGTFSTVVAQKAREYISANGHLDTKFDQQMSDYLKQHPIFNNVELEHPAVLGAPEASPDVKTIAQLHAWASQMGLKKGDPIRLPNGTIKAAP